VGWSDWGSVERILASAKEMGRLHEIATRLNDCKLNDPSTRPIVAQFLSLLNANRPGYGAARSQYPRPVGVDI
jgi:hypothetical protein